MEKQLRKKLEQKMVTTEWNRHRRSFLPHGHEAELITFDNIKCCIPNTPTDLANFVFQQAKKVFAILVHSKCQDGDLEDALSLCKAHGLTDEKLPIPKVDDICFHDSTPDEGNAQRGCWHQSYLNVFHDKDWGSSAWASFYRDQWHFLAPVFSFHRFEYEFAQDTILPIVGYGDGDGAGNFGVVEEAYLHLHHLQGYSEVCTAT